MNPEVKNNQPGENAETGWEELENLEQEDFSAEEKVEDFQIPDETSREEQLADARNAVEAAYSAPSVVEQPAPIVENKEIEPDMGIRVKRRPKFDIIGRKLDERRARKIDEAIEDATSTTDIDELVEEASKNLDEHTAGMLLDYIEYGIPGALGVKVWSRLAEKVNSDDLRDAIDNAHVNPTFFVQRNGADLTGKVLSTFVDASVAQLQEWSEETSKITPSIFDKYYSELDNVRDLPPEEKSKYIDVALEKNRPGNVLQLLDDGLLDVYRDKLSESIKENEISPIQAVTGYLKGMTIEELGMPESFKTAIDGLLAMDVPDRAIEYTVGSIPSAEIFDTLGVDLSTHIIQTTVDDLSHVTSSREYFSLTFDSKEEAEQLKKVYDFLGDRKDELGLAQMDFLRSHGKLVDEFMAKGEITEKQLQSIAILRSLQVVTDIDVNSIEELDNFDEVLAKKVDEMLNMVETISDPNERESTFEAIKDSISIMMYGVPRNNLKILARRTRLITDDRKRYDQIFEDVNTEELRDDEDAFKLFRKDRSLNFSLDKFDELVRDGKLSPEDEGEVLAMLAYLNAGNNPKKLREVLELSRKNPDGAGAFYRSLEKLDKIMLLESNQNFGKDMTTPEQLIADGAEVSTVEFTDKDGEAKQIQVIDLGGRPFKILTHCLGAFGGFDLGQPDFWDNGTGAKYISSSLIADNCIRTAGKRNTGLYYGFSNLGAESIVGMSSGDLYTYGIDYIGDKTPDDDEDNSKTRVTAGRQSFWYSTPDELIDDTRSRGRIRKFSEKNDFYHAYNEVVLNRYNGGPNGDRNDRLHPSCILCFGKDESAISEDMKRHAAYFGIPIYIIDEDKYGDK